MGQPYVLFINIVVGIYGALRACGWIIVYMGMFAAESKNSELLRSKASDSVAKMSKGCIVDIAFIAWWITYFVAVRRI